MFNKNFYPTPPEVAEKMMEGWVHGRDVRILEPSAGKGDICDVLYKKWKIRNFSYSDGFKNQISCIELEPDLQAILRDKGYSVIHNDFLSYNPDIIYDLIIMNPPFDTGTKHFLKAWEISKGAEIRCLLNAETIRNPHTKERQTLLNILEDNNGEVVYLGHVFKSAERHTGVDVAYIKIKDKDLINFFQFTPDSSSRENHYTVNDLTNNQLAKYNVFEDLVARYDRVKNTFADHVKSLNEIEYYADGLLASDLYTDVKKLIKDTYSSDPKEYYNNFMDKFRYECWSNILRKTKIANIVTSKVQLDFQKSQQEQGSIPFTIANIEMLLDQLFYNKDEIFQQCIVDAFDLMTKYHNENRIHIEGWKTNDQWKVNRKVILPNMKDTWSYDTDRVRIDYRSKDKLNDIEKALCFIAGKKFEDIISITLFVDKTECWYGELYESEFFEFRFYKKGTVHLKFKDDFIYEQFNILACKGKNWLGA